MSKRFNQNDANESTMYSLYLIGSAKGVNNPRFQEMMKQAVDSGILTVDDTAMIRAMITSPSWQLEDVVYLNEVDSIQNEIDKLEGGAKY